MPKKLGAKAAYTEASTGLRALMLAFVAYIIADKYTPFSFFINFVWQAPIRRRSRPTRRLFKRRVKKSSILLPPYAGAVYCTAKPA